MEVKSKDQVLPYFTHLTSHPFHLTSEKQKWICALFAVVVITSWYYQFSPSPTGLITLRWTCQWKYLGTAWFWIDLPAWCAVLAQESYTGMSSCFWFGVFPLLYPALRLQAFSSPSNLQIQTCRFPLGSAQTLLGALPWAVGRSCLSVPSSPLLPCPADL